METASTSIPQVLSTRDLVFVCNSEQRAVYEYVSVGAMTQLSPSVSPAALRGIYLKNSGRDETEYIAYSADNLNWIETDIPSKFSDEEYLTGRVWRFGRRRSVRGERPRRL